MDANTVTERELSLAQAHQRLHQELATLKLQANIRTLGNHIVSVQATLGHCPQQPQARGGGKGLLEHARVGALYEALEHYLSEQYDTLAIHFKDASYLRNNALFHDDSVLNPLIENNAQGFACRTYTSPLDNRRFSYPLVLSSSLYAHNPVPGDATDYRSLRRYGSNSGTAIGATPDEAVLHAINECIERDAVSLFLLDHFYYQNPVPLKRVVRPPLTEPCGQRWAQVEAEIGAPVVLLDISSEFLAKTYLAFSLAPSPLPRVFGSGTSLDGQHAAWRALSELTQVHLNSALAPMQQQLRAAQGALRRFSRLQRCLQFDAPSLLARARQCEVELPNAVPQPTLARQIHLLAEDLHRHHRTLGISTLYHSALGTTLANVVIPGLERFYIVSSGNVVVPQERGRRLAPTSAQGIAAHG